MNPIRWGVIGIGRFGRIHARVVESLSQTELVAICNRNPEKLAAAAEEFTSCKTFSDYQAMLSSDDIDAVSIATHWREHAAVAEAALAAGKHVLLEKPMAATRGECERLMSAAARSKGYLMVGHVCRFDPRITLAKQAIEQGRLGQLVSMHAKRNLPVAAGNIRLDKISPLMGDGIHDADLMMWFVERAPTRIYAHELRFGGFTYPDVGWAMLHFGDQAMGVIETNWHLPPNVATAIDARFEIIGTEGKLTIDCAHTGLEILDPRGLRMPDTAYWPTQHGRPVGAIVNEIQYFADCIYRRSPPQVVPLKDSARAVAVMERAEQSAAAGEPLAFDDGWA